MAKLIRVIQATGLPRGTVLVDASGSRARFMLVGGRAPAPGPPPLVLNAAPTTPGGTMSTLATQTEALAAEPVAAESEPVNAIVLGLPSWIFPSLNSVAYDNAGDIVLPAVGVEATIFSFQVPRGFNGVMKSIGNNFVGGGFDDGSGALVWRVLQNNQAMRGKENLINSLGSVAQPSLIGGGGFMRILENDVISMTVLNVSVTPAGQIVGGRLSGWFYPKDEDPAGIWF